LECEGCEIAAFAENQVAFVKLRTIDGMVRVRVRTRKASRTECMPAVGLKPAVNQAWFAKSLTKTLRVKRFSILLAIRREMFRSIGYAGALNCGFSLLRLDFRGWLTPSRATP
jgi:hypothetical protein